MRKSRWVSAAAWVHHGLGILLYSYEIVIASGILTGVASAVASYFGLHLFAVLLAVLLSVSLIALGFVQWIRAYKIQHHGPNPGLKILLRENTYTWLGGNLYQQINSIVAEALHNGVENYKHTFLWSGKGRITPSIQSKGQTIALGKNSINTKDQCVIHFESPLRKGHQESILYKLDMVDEANSAKPVLANYVPCLIGKLVLRVRFPPESNIDKYKRRRFLSAQSEIAVFEETVQISSGSSEAVWEIPHPRLGFNYQISW